MPPPYVADYIADRYTTAGYYTADVQEPPDYQRQYFLTPYRNEDIHLPHPEFYFHNSRKTY